MRNVIRQTVVLPASAEALFEMYLDPSAHEAITGTTGQLHRVHGLTEIECRGCG